MKREKKTTSHFVLCIKNDGCEDLEPRKVYKTLPDEAAAEDGYNRAKQVERRHRRGKQLSHMGARAHKTKW